MATRWTRWASSALLWSAAGCSAGDFALGAGDSGIGDAADEDGAGGGEDGGDGTAGYWWKLSATLPVVDGALRAEGASLAVVVLDDSAAVACEVSLDLTEAEPLESPDPVIFAWWRLSSSPWEGACGVQSLPSPLPDTLELGVGALHPEIEVMLPSIEALSPLAYPQINAAYARLGEDAPVFAYGLAGVEAAYLGEGSRVEEAPLPDGEYVVQAIFAFDY
jgi:hypothetical protein